MKAVLVAGLVLLAGAARADDLGDAGARQVSGLFARACLGFAGDPQGTRAWLDGVKVPHLKPEAQATFMRGHPGIGYDASRGPVRLALLSADDGTCTAMATAATPGLVVQLTEAFLRTNGTAPRLLADSDDAHAPGLHRRDYGVTWKARPYNLLLSTSDAGRVQAMLTLGPAEQP